MTSGVGGFDSLALPPDNFQLRKGHLCGWSFLFVQLRTEKKRWEFNPVAAKKKLREWETKRRFQIVLRGANIFLVYGCPKPKAFVISNKPYANVRRDCYNCEFLVLDSQYGKVSEFTLSYPPTPHGYILCGWPGLTEVVE